MSDLTPEQRAQLIDAGWTPPNKHTIEHIPVVGYQHPVRPDLLTADPNAYTGLSAGSPNELVRKDAVYDRIDWLEHGVDEWRSVAMAARAILSSERQHMQSLLILAKRSAHILAEIQDQLSGADQRRVRPLREELVDRIRAINPEYYGG